MRTSAFIDASNLFYGGKKSLGWSIDYEKLLAYLKEKYDVKTAYYFGGVEIHRFPFDMAFRLMLEQNAFDRAVVLSGDGDFLPVLKYLRQNGKKMYVLARSRRTAKEIKQFAASEFRDFEYLRELLKRDDEETV